MYPFLQRNLCIAGKLFCFTTLSLFFFINAGAQCSFTIATNNTDVLCYNGTSGAITVNVSGGTAPFLYQQAEAGAGAFQASNTFTGLSAGVKPVSVKDATGCIQTIYTTINQPSAALSVISYAGADASCQNGNNGKITISAGGGTSPYTYAWTKNGAAFSTNSNLSNLAPANYNLIVTDANGCTAAPVIISQEKKITVTGYNQDVLIDPVLNTPNPTSLTTAGIDVGGATFFMQGYSTNATALPNGIPASGQFTSSAGHAFQLAPYNQNNALQLLANQSGTFTLAGQNKAAYSTLYVIGASGNGGPTANYTVHFADNSTFSGAVLIEDWFCNSCTPYALKDLSRVSRTNGAVSGSNQFAIREYPIALSVANQSKNITSVDFAIPNGQTGTANIFGFTGVTSTLVGIQVNDGPVGSSVTPSVSITSNAVSSTFCPGQNVTFTAAPVYEGSAPTYQWKVNGVNAGTNAPSFSTNALANNDKVSVVLTSSLSCVTASTANSNMLTLIQGNPAASVSISVDKSNFCSGTKVTFTSTSINGGNTPAYQWKVNGINAGANSPLFSTSNLANNDQVTVVLTSSIGCASSNPATSNSITNAVTATVAPSATISSNPSIPYQHSPATFTVSVTNQGTSPVYQWFKNGTAIAGATSSSYTEADPATGDQYSVKLSSNYICITTPAVMSNYLKIASTPLPVSLEYFTARLANGQVYLQWKAAQQLNNKQFIIDRANASGSLNFEQKGMLPAFNGANNPVYNFTDIPPLPGTYLYRLSQQDIDGTIKTLGTRSITINGRRTWVINDVGNQWQLISSLPLHYRLLNMNGQLLKEYSGPGNIIIPKPAAHGIYQLQLETNGEYFTKKLIK